MLDIGRVCVKTAGKDAGKMVVVVDVMEGPFVLIDGPIKRKRCNMLHLEPTQRTLKIKKGSSHADVVKEFKKIDVEIKDSKPKAKKSPKPQRKQRLKKGQPATQKGKTTPPSKGEKKSKEKPKAPEKK